MERKEVGTIHSYELCPGVIVSFYDLKVTTWENDNQIEIKPNVIEINHCEQGRYECEFSGDSFYYLGEEEIAVSRLSDKKTMSSFPLGMYKGINILIDLDMCDNYLFGLLDLFQIDIDKLIQKWKQNLPCYIVKESKAVQTIFKQLYEREESMQYGFLQCKVVELLLLFEQYEIGTITANTHFKRSQVEKAKHIRVHLEQELDREITLSELSREHEISESSVKRCFGAIYGKTPSQYRKEYRMQMAAKLLVETQQNIAEIGMQMGYLNSSKFSTAFQSILHMTPSAYRNEK